MGPAVFVIAILGCGEADAPCQQLSVAPAAYASFADCTRATDGVLAETADADFPVVVAQCKAAGTPASLELRPEDVKLPEHVRPPRSMPMTYQAPKARRG
jgi:hypothetical protein